MPFSTTDVYVSCLAIIMSDCALGADAMRNSHSGEEHHNRISRVFFFLNLDDEAIKATWGSF